ncbi:hypothetical protein [Salipaludibacillus sp. CF4.18]|uniref:hypothetical protein n=1 Tax=Salipaludibacillus sp. CF4.18 TaxID=3373081 RepID=UPI003EE57526
MLQVGANAGDNLEIILTDAREEALGIDNLSVLDRTLASEALERVDQAIAKVWFSAKSVGIYLY